MDMMIDRTGKWAWALTPAQCLVAVTVSAAQQEGTPIAPKLERGFQPGGSRGFTHASRRAATEPAALREDADDRPVD